MVASALAGVLGDTGLLEEWLRPLDDAIREILYGLPADAVSEAQDADFRRRLQDARKRAPDLFEAMRTDALEERVAAAMFAADANGRVERARRLRGAGDTRALADPADQTDRTDPGPYLVAPSTFTAAKDWFGRKVTLPTGLNAAELALQWPQPVKNQAFFSAQIAKANILGSFREQIDRILDGELSYGEARKNLTEFLAREGYGIPAPHTAEDYKLADIASTGRIELLLRQNVDMAQSIGQRAVSEHPYVAERFPNYRYIANTERHAEFDGLVLPKDHPFWATHYPPWDYGCKCICVDEDAEVNVEGGEIRDVEGGAQEGRLVRNGQTIPVLPPESGFVFRSDPASAFGEFDVSSVEDPELRGMLEKAMKKRKLET